MASTGSRNKPTDLIQTTHGPVKGFISNGMRHYLGIPYAAPPIGDLRWRPSIPPRPWTEPLEATSFGNVCAQTEQNFTGLGHESSTEDCLYLNVFLSDDIEERQELRKKLPVIALIPGGGFFCGGSNGYDPSWLVKEGQVVVVSLNYRLNVFGFFSHPAINAEDHPAGNYGFMDQQLALTWIRDNIERFGGDAGNVTLMGESAGGFSVLAHVASPLSKGLYHRAIVQSGGSPPTLRTPSLGALEEKGVDLADELDCGDQTAEILRSASTQRLLEANKMPKGQFGIGRYHFGVMEDGIVIPSDMREKFLNGEFNKVPMIMGVNKDEFTYFQAYMEYITGNTTSPDSYPQMLAGMFTGDAALGLVGLKLPPNAIDRVIQRYPVEARGSASQALAAAVGDAGIIATAGRRTGRVIKKSVPEVYVYEFDVPNSPVCWPAVSFPYGSAHTQELQYLFPLWGGNKTAPALNPSQRELAGRMVRYWTTFAWTGNPNPSLDSPLARWTVYKPEKDNVMLLQAPSSKMIDQWGEVHHCDFWDEFYL